MSQKYLTLVEKINEIPKLLSSYRLKEAEKIVFEEFIENNFLEREIAKGDKSYTDLTELVHEKYETIKKRILHPKIDEDFDIHTKGLIKSMRSVGLFNLDPDVYTTEGRRKKMQNIEKMALGGGLSASAVNAYFSFSCSKDDESEEVKIPIWVKALLSLGLAVIPYAVCKKLHNDQMNQALDKLEDAAIQSDKYLRSMYLKLS